MENQKRKMSESDLTDVLMNLCEYELQGCLEEMEKEMGDDEQVAYDVRTQTFSEANLLTRNEGFVLKINGQKFQITIVKA